MGVPARCRLPKCPKCEGGGLVVPVREHHRAGEYARDVRLVCMECGDGFAGTDAEVAKAERASRAADRYLEADDKRARKRERDKAQQAAYERAMRVGLGR